MRKKLQCTYERERKSRRIEEKQAAVSVAPQQISTSISQLLTLDGDVAAVFRTKLVTALESTQKMPSQLRDDFLAGMYVPLRVLT